MSNEDTAPVTATPPARRTTEVGDQTYGPTTSPALASSAHEPTPRTFGSPASASLAADDVERFAEFYRLATPQLVGFLMWQGAPLHTAADCVQEAMTLCYRKWLSIEKPLPWCRTVASRMYARRVADVEDPVDDLENELSPLISADADVEGFLTRHSILAEIDKLPPRQRQVMAWTYAGASTKEIAVELRISESNVRQNLSKARAKLRIVKGGEET